MKANELILLKLKELNLKKPKFVSDALGYKNIDKGLKRLNAILNDGQILTKDIPAIAETLQISEEQLNDAINETNIDRERQMEEGKQYKIASFCPRFYSMNKHVIPINFSRFSVYQYYEKCVYYNEDFKNLSLDDQLRQVKLDLIIHYSENSNKSSPYGKITHYIYRNDLNLSLSDLILLDTNGDVMKNSEGFKRKIY